VRTFLFSTNIRKELKMDLLEDLYTNYGTPNYLKNTDSEKLRDMMLFTQLRIDEFKKTLDEEQVKRMDVIENSLEEISARENYHAFRNGVSFAMKLFLESGSVMEEPMYNPLDIQRSEKEN